MTKPKPITRRKPLAKQKTDWPNKTATKGTCCMIQWAGDYILNGIAVCPRCHEPAEKVIGIMSNACWAHKI